MDSKSNIVEILQGNIKIVQYNKPRRKNALDVEMYMTVTKILNDGAKDDSISTIVLTGTGDYFSSGNDLSNSASQDGFNTILKEFIKAFIQFPKLLIAIVNGPAIGIAATTLGLCDLVFAAANAYFYTPFSKLGIVAEGCSSFTFPRIMGDRKAIEMLLFNYKMPAKEALECGFVNELFTPEELQTKVWDKIIEVSKLSMESLIISKKLLRRNLTELLQTNEDEIYELNKIWKSKM